MHPQNQSWLDALNACVAACEHCATACLQEHDGKTMASCITLDRDCADICALTARLLTRGSAHAPHLLRECAKICRLCGGEYGRHPHEHCRVCAAACRRCEEACHQALMA